MNENFQRMRYDPISKDSLKWNSTFNKDIPFKYFKRLTFDFDVESTVPIESHDVLVLNRLQYRLAHIEKILAQFVCSIVANDNTKPKTKSFYKCNAKIVVCCLCLTYGFIAFETLVMVKFNRIFNRLFSFHQTNF